MRKVGSAIWVGIFFIILLTIFELSLVRRVVEGRLMPVLFWFEKPFANIFFRARIDSDIERLIEENRRLQEDISRLKDAEREEALLSSLRASTPRLFYLEDPVSARLIGTSSEKRGIIFLDKGREAGLVENDVVFLPANTLVGQIEKVYGTFSVAKTLFSGDLRVAASIGDGRLPGLFSNPDGNERAGLSLIPKTGELKPGLIVETSGKDGVLPAGMILGTIESVQDFPAEVTRSATMRLSFSPAFLEYILIAKNPLTQ